MPKRVTVHNPASSVLHIINGGSMATTRKKKTTTTTTANRGHRRHNPGRKATTVASNGRRRKNSVVILTPAQARSAGMAQPNRGGRGRRRKSNPAVKGMIIDAMWAFAGGAVTNVVAGLIPFHADGLMGIGVRFGAAYLAGFIGEKVFGGHAGQMMAIGGGAAAAGELVNYAFGKVGAAATGFASNAQPAAAAPLPPGADAGAPAMGGGYYDPNYFITDGMHDIVDASSLSDIYGWQN